MNKQELIEKIKANGEWFETNRYVKITKAVELISQLDEPQKVKVPAFVAEKMKRYKSALWMLSSEYFDTSLEVDSDELTNWIDQNSEEFFRAWLDGYEVEEEPKWVVKVDDNAYFVDFFDSLTPHLVDGLGWEVMRLDDKSKADAVALIIGGKAEKVEV